MKWRSYFRLKNTLPHLTAFQSGGEAGVLLRDAVEPAGACRSYLGFAELRRAVDAQVQRVPDLQIE